MEQQTERAGAGDLPDARDAADAGCADAGCADAGDGVGAAVGAAALADAGDEGSWSASGAGGGPASERGSRRHVTGEPTVDAALARLDELVGQPVTEHRAIFDEVHRRLREVLGELDTREQGSGDAAAGERRAGR